MALQSKCCNEALYKSVNACTHAWTVAPKSLQYIKNLECFHLEMEINIVLGFFYYEKVYIFSLVFHNKKPLVDN